MILEFLYLYIAYIKSVDELRRHQKHLLDNNLEEREDFEDDDNDLEEWAAASKQTPSSPVPAKRGRKPKQFVVPDDGETWVEPKKTPPSAKRGRKPKPYPDHHDMEDWESNIPTLSSLSKRGKKSKQLHNEEEGENLESKHTPTQTKKRRKSKPTPKAIIEEEGDEQ